MTTYWLASWLVITYSCPTWFVPVAIKPYVCTVEKSIATFLTSHRSEAERAIEAVGPGAVGKLEKIEKGRKSPKRISWKHNLEIER